jgi:hypothetical protein
MKQKDIALILVVIFISVVFSLLVSKWLISSPRHRSYKVEVVQPITADFTPPDKKYFNENSFDPTKLIQIGNDSNSKPFNTTTE